MRIKWKKIYDKINDTIKKWFLYCIWKFQIHYEYIYMIENENMNWRENEFEHEKGFDKNNFNKQSLNESVFINQSFFLYLHLVYRILMIQEKLVGKVYPYWFQWFLNML